MGTKIPSGFDRSNWPLPDEFLREVGRLSVLWTGLDDQLNTCIGKLAGFNDLLDMRPFILVKHSSFQQKLDVLSSLCEHLLAKYPWLQSYKNVVSQIKSAQTLRNRFVHNALVQSEDGKSVEIAVGSARGKLKTSVERVTNDEIKNASVAIVNAKSSLHLLITGRNRPPFLGKGSA